jgi:hypothetical protein
MMPDQTGSSEMPNLGNTNFLWGLISALALVIGLVAGRMGLVGQSPDTLSLANFRADFPLKQIQAKTFKNETVQLDGNAFIDCTFDNVVFKFDGQAPFTFTNDHIVDRTKIAIVSNNPLIKTTLGLMGAFIKLETPAQNQPQQSK